MIHVAAFSGGKDSTAMVLLMHQQGMPIDHLLITPTGDELPELEEHWASVADLVGVPLTVPKGPTLSEVIEENSALPNFRMRFCTRMVKIVPAIAWVQSQVDDVVMYVGLRADEPERKGIISEGIDTRFPLRDAGMGLREVWDFLGDLGIAVPARTDCARCYHQRIGEWWQLWHHHPAIWADAEAQERTYGATFRTPGRDSWPTSLADLRAEFERGRVPVGAQRAEARKRFALESGRSILRPSQLTILGDEEQEDEVCRVCSL